MFTVEQFRNDLVPIFMATQHHSLNGFYCSLLHIVDSPELNTALQKAGSIPISTKFRFNLTPKSLHGVTNLSAFVDYLESQNNSPEFLLMYSKLYAYLQALESKYIYKVLGNFLRVLLNQNPVSVLYDNLHSGHQCFSRLVKLHDQLVTTGTCFALFDKLSTIMERSLRNAIAHNDIYLDSESQTLLIPSLKLRTIMNPQEIAADKEVYSFNDLSDYYKSATNFVEAFKGIVSTYVDLGKRY
jgi:hypothetical protein